MDCCPEKVLKGEGYGWHPIYKSVPRQPSPFVPAPRLMVLAGGAAPGGAWLGGVNPQLEADSAGRREAKNSVACPDPSCKTQVITEKCDCKKIPETLLPILL